MGGDWNEIPDMLIKRLNKSKCNMHAISAPKRGTRFKSDGQRSERPIDYAISNNEMSIMKQKRLLVIDCPITVLS